MNLDDVFRKKFENDLRIKKKRLIALKKFINFLKKFEKNPNNYRKIVIQIDYFERGHTTRKCTEFKGDEIAKVLNIMNLLLIKSDITCYDEMDIATTFWFRDNSDVYCEKIIEMNFFKK